ncbi:MAG: hypothetical protein M3Q63_03380 [bacterium]|nr:hypothetical protein [bacterium]
MNKSSRGFVALISIVLVSAVLSLVVIEASTQAYFVRLYIEENAYKVQSYYSARSCLEIARSNIITNSLYKGNEVIFLERYSCSIFPIERTGPSITITTQAIIGESQTTLSYRL